MSMWDDAGDAEMLVGEEGCHGCFLPYGEGHEPACPEYELPETMLQPTTFDDSPADALTPTWLVPATEDA